MLAKTWKLLDELMATMEREFSELAHMIHTSDKATKHHRTTTKNGHITITGEFKTLQAKYSALEQSFARLIEDQFSPQVRWWRGSGYTVDANEAVRFRRKEDAERVILTTLARETFPLIATEHGWCLTEKPQSDKEKQS